MENLNAEQIKSDLEHCKFGKDKPICEGCNYKSWIKPRCFGLLCSNALALIKSQEQRIKELTEENKAWQMQLISTEEKADKAYYELACEVEKLRTENANLHASCTEFERKCASLNDEKQIKADTVRKMQERVEALFPSDKKYTTISRFSVNQIAKEMLEGKADANN